MYASLGQCNDLSVLSLDELLDLDVVSVTKMPGKVADTPAAISIITGEDLRRNGVRTLPEALRLVPGMHVYQIDANKWAISARGFSSRFSNKMLVMIDGRTVYSTLFSGVFWDVQDLLIEDIDRIEVIRGPGGTLWGANAVNGIINILTKDSADTQGTLLSLRGQTGPDGEVAARYGGWLNDKTSWRVYGKFFDRANFDNVAGGEGHDEWHQARVGVRMDMRASATEKLTLQGDIYGGKSGEAVRYEKPTASELVFTSVDAPVSGGNVLARWNTLLANRSEVTLQAYYDRIERNEFYIDETLDTFDLDFQHQLPFSDTLEILYGLSYRYTKSQAETKETIPGFFSYAMHPMSREDDLVAAFVQGKYSFAGGRGEITLGSKLEYNETTEFEWQPSVRGLWRINTDHNLWAAVSRSVRTPSRLELDAEIRGGLMRPPVNGLKPFIHFSGNPDLRAEKITSYEAGYRGRLSEDSFLDISLYYNKYTHLISALFNGRPYPQFTSEGALLVVPILVANAGEQEIYGAELSCNWSLASWWRLTGGYSWLRQVSSSPGKVLVGRQGFGEDQNARHLVSLVSYMDLPHDVELNTSLYYAGSLDGLGISSHTSLDLGVIWHPDDMLSFAAGVKNVFDDGHQEFTNTLDDVMASAIPRVFYTKLTMSF